MTRIARYGWRLAGEPGLGRVVSAHGDYYRLVADEVPTGEILARKKKSVFTRMKTAASADMKAAKIPGGRAPAPAAAPTPITGDFVRFSYNRQGDSLITAVLPRRSHFERQDPTARRQVQTLAVNFDTLFIMMALTENFSLPRLRRYLELAADIGEAQAVVVLTKRDLVPPAVLAERLAAAGELAAPHRVAAVSAVTAAGLEEIRGCFAPQATVAFIGSSGVGKSTLLNVLAGAEVARAGEVQEWSGKGRHTTTSRELVMLPNGAMVIDTPGIREIGRLGEVERLQVKGESCHRYRK